jgi:hypothetical protein
VISRWLLGEWSFRRGWSVTASAGSSRQLPELDHFVDEMASPHLRPERAAHLDLGIEQQLANGIRWRTTMFTRREAEVIRPPDRNPRLLANDLVLPDAEERFANALRGTSKGIELVVSRQSPRGMSGWVTYAYARTQQSDAARGETYWADFDQRHTLNALAQYRFSAASVGATLRAGSNFPIPGYFAISNGRMLVGHARNLLRLPPYARLDVRADREFHYASRSFRLFVEGLNVLDRLNTGVAEGSVDPVTRAAIGFTDTLLRRRISAGIVFEF